MKTLEINPDDFLAALANEDQETAHFLDLETGDVLLADNGILYELEEGYEENARQLYKSLRMTLEDAPEKLIADNKENFLEINRISTREAYYIMDDFARSVKDASLRTRLLIACEGRGALSRFDNSFHGYPDQQNAWFRHRNTRMLDIARKWLNMHKIEPIFGNEPVLQDEEYFEYE